MDYKMIMDHKTRVVDLKPSTRTVLLALRLNEDKSLSKTGWWAKYFTVVLALIPAVIVIGLFWILTQFFGN